MAEKNLNSRIVHKHDIEVNWSKATNFIPKIGEIIVYDPDENHAAARVKIGDGVKTVIELAFIDDAAKAALFEEIDMVDEKVETLGQLVGNVSVPEQIEEALLKTQADWEVNDETNATYVKNRTHWEETIIASVVEETTVNILDVNSHVLNPFAITIEENTNYIVTWDNTKYNCLSYVAAGPNSLSIGNSSIANASGGGNNEPFFLTVYNGSVMLFANEIGEHTIVITKYTSIIYQLDEKYIPISNSDWNEQDENKRAFIKNKTHWIEQSYILLETEYVCAEGRCDLEYCPINDSPDDFLDGNYIATVDGIEYDVPGRSGGTGGFAFENYDVPFRITFSPPSKTIFFYPVDGTHIVSLRKKDIIHQLDEKYIPDTIARTADIITPVQSDWNENDENSLSFVKNRTHWENIVNTPIVEETTIVFDEAIVNNPFSIVIEDNTHYTVIWDGIEYNCTSYIAPGPNIPCIGNGGISGVSGGNNEPFFITVFQGDVMVFAETIGEHIISILALKNTVHCLDKKYIDLEYNDLKNCPLYEKNTYKLIFITDNSLVPDDPSASVYAWQFDLAEEYNTPVIKVGTDYLVEYCGNSQVITAINLGSERYPEPFVIVDGYEKYQFGFGWNGYAYNDIFYVPAELYNSDNFSFAIYEIGIDFKQLDEKFIPDTIIRKKDIHIDNQVQPNSNLVTGYAVATYAPKQLHITDSFTGMVYHLSIQNGELVITNGTPDDFTYTSEEDGTYTLTGWNETYMGEPSTECILPNSELINL